MKHIKTKSRIGMRVDEQKKLIEFIKKEMRFWFGFDLTSEQIKPFLIENNIDSFDTLERDDFINYLSQKICGLYWPMNGDSQTYKDEFYLKFNENFTKMGFKYYLGD